MTISPPHLPLLPASETTHSMLPVGHRSYSICRTYIGYGLTRHYEYVVKFDLIFSLVLWYVERKQITVKSKLRT